MWSSTSGPSKSGATWWPFNRQDSRSVAARVRPLVYCQSTIKHPVRNPPLLSSVFPTAVI